MKIAIIGGGNMGGAIARGLSQGTKIKASEIYVSDVCRKNLDALKAFNSAINVSESNAENIKEADIILIAVKPWLVEVVAKEIANLIDYKHQIVLSIAAGVPFAKLIEFFSAEGTFFRMIPNTAVEVLQSLSTIASLNATKEQEEMILGIFNELGKAILVQENQMNAFMALSSCGIAYAFRYIRAATEGGVEMGIYPDVAKQVVLQTLRGAISLIEAHDSHPEVEIDKVTTPGGITIKGLNEMEAQGFTNSVIKGLKASLIK